MEFERPWVGKKKVPWCPCSTQFGPLDWLDSRYFLIRDHAGSSSQNFPNHGQRFFHLILVIQQSVLEIAFHLLVKTGIPFAKAFSTMGCCRDAWIFHHKGKLFIQKFQRDGHRDNLWFLLPANFGQLDCPRKASHHLLSQWHLACPTNELQIHSDLAKTLKQGFSYF